MDEQMNPGAAAAAEEAEKEQTEVKAVEEAGGAVVIEQTEEGAQVLTAEQLAEVNKAGTGDEVVNEGELDETQLAPEPAYKSYEDFFAQAISTTGSTRAIIEQLKQTPEVLDGLSNQIDEQLDVINKLLGSKFEEQDNQGLYPELLELKTELEEIKLNKFKGEIEALIGSFPEGIFTGELEGADTDERVENVALKLAVLVSNDSEQQQKIKELIVSRINGTDLEGVKKTIDAKTGVGINPDVVDANLTDIENEETDEEKKEEIKKVRKLLKMIGYSSVALGIAANTVFDKSKINIDDLISFLLNPVRPTRAYDSSRTGEKGETIPSHEFKSRFANPELAGKALFIASEALQEQDKFKTWRADNISDLRNLKDGSKGNESLTHSLFVSLDKVALADMVDNKDANWDLFGNAYASALFGGEVTLDTVSREFLKEQLKNDGEKLKAFWGIGGATASSEPEQVAVGEVVQQDSVPDSVDSGVETDQTKTPL